MIFQTRSSINAYMQGGHYGRKKLQDL
jgi:hypothetical protein